MKLVSSLVVVAILVMVAYLTVPGLGSHIKQVPKDIGQVIDDGSSDDHIIGMADSQFGVAEADLRGRYARVYYARQKINDLEADLQAKRTELAREDQILNRARQLLKENPPGEIIKVGGAQYTWEQLNQDALMRVQNCQSLKRTLVLKEESLAQLKKNAEAGKKAILAHQSKLEAAKNQFKIDKVELEALRVQEEVNQLAGEVANSGDFKDFGGARTIIRKRISDLKANTEFDQHGRVSPISWEESGVSSASAVELIDSYLPESRRLVPVSPCVVDNK